MSDILNIQPNAGQTPNEDTTFEIVGYDTHVENLEKQYPEEEPIVPEMGNEFSPLAEPESNVQPTESTESSQTESTDTQESTESKSEGNKLFERGIARQNKHWELDPTTGNYKIDSFYEPFCPMDIVSLRITTIQRISYFKYNGPVHCIG